MDARRFDRLVLAVSDRTDRRRLGSLVAALVGAALAAPEAEAARCSKSKPCPPCQRCRKRKCRPSTDNSGCAEGEVCSGGQCTAATCPGDLRGCANGQCRECCVGETNADDHCCPAQRPNCHGDSVYGIFKRCETGGVCACPAEYPAYCDTGSGIPACHQCCTSNDCAANEAANAQGRTNCFFGNCVCPEGQDLCRVFGSVPLRSACTDTKTDRTNCGSCAFVCPTQQHVCVNGGCVIP
jgi:hypothetical protein